jgi:hypothetical protein
MTIAPGVPGDMHTQTLPPARQLFPTRVAHRWLGLLGLLSCC